ncbi:MAG: GFA family protein [Alphaproteobacteria bacterium]|nr:GFA family protein [Alphaproteobacteria bacterium]
MYSGQCMCGEVRYEIHGPIRDVIACHCEQCRRVSGHFIAATAAHHEHIKITNDAGLAWFEGTATIRRGFCKLCGSTLFFDHGSAYPMGITAGSLDNSDDVTLRVHIWTNEAGHYYKLDGDGVPTFTSAQWRARQGWDPLSWSDGENHVEGARKFDDYERAGKT